MSLESHEQYFPILVLMKEDANIHLIETQILHHRFSLIMWLRVDFPMRYANDRDCCDYPDARKLKITASLSPADIALQNLCLPLTILFSTNPSK